MSEMEDRRFQRWRMCFNGKIYAFIYEIVRVNKKTGKCLIDQDGIKYWVPIGSVVQIDESVLKNLIKIYKEKYENERI